MKVFHRFAPCTSNDDVIQVEIFKRRGGGASQNNTSTKVHLSDPFSRGEAVFHCHDAMMPVDPSPANLSLHPSSPQEELYFKTVRPVLESFPSPHNTTSTAAGGRKGVTASSSKGLILTYGQTGSGKTYSLFGPPADIYENKDNTKCFEYSIESIQYFQQYLCSKSNTFGVVMRYVLDVFHSIGMQVAASNKGRNGSLQLGLDVAAFEIYNETTTDLVALALTDHASQATSETGGSRKPPLPRRASRTASVCSSTQGSVTTSAKDMWAKKETAFTKAPTFVSTSHRYYCSTTPSEETLQSAATAPVKQVGRKYWLKRAKRIRVTSVVEAVAALQELLQARQCSSTEHNSYSSRSHLGINMECFTYTVATRETNLEEDLNNGFCYSEGEEATRYFHNAVHPEQFCYEEKLHEILFMDLAGSESYRENPNQTSRWENTSRHGGGGASSLNASFSSNTSGNDRSRRGSRSALLRSSSADEDRMRKEKGKRSLELKHINTSLLSLKKVIHELHKISTNDKARPTHVPFKDSLLTALLEPFMLPHQTTSNNSITILLCCSLKQKDFFETVSTLRLGAEAAGIQPTVCLESLPYLHQQRLREEEQELLGLLKANQRQALRQQRQRRSASLSFDSRRKIDEKDSVNRNGRRDFHRTASAPLPPRRPSETTLQNESKDTETLERVRKEAQQYKSTAEELYRQCRSLCDGYDACVKELKEAKTKLREKDERIAELERLLLHLTTSPKTDPTEREQTASVKEETIDHPDAITEAHPCDCTADRNSAENPQNHHSSNLSLRDHETVKEAISKLSYGAAFYGRSPSPWTPGMEVVLSPRSSASRSCSLAAAAAVVVAGKEIPPPEVEEASLASTPRDSPLSNKLSPLPKVPCEGQGEPEFPSPVAACLEETITEPDRESSTVESPSTTERRNTDVLKGLLAKQLFSQVENKPISFSILQDSTNCLPAAGEKRGSPQKGNATTDPESNNHLRPTSSVPTPSAPPSRIYRM